MALRIRGGAGSGEDWSGDDWTNFSSWLGKYPVYSSDPTEVGIEKLKQWWDLNGGQSLPNITPDQLAAGNSLVTHPAEEEYRKFLPEFKADLQFIPDDHLKQFKNGQFLI